MGVVGHAGFVEHDDAVAVEAEAAVFEAGEERGDGVGVDAGVVADGAGSLAGGRGGDHVAAFELERVADGAQGGGLAGAGDPDDHIQAASRRAHPGDGAALGGGELHRQLGFGAADGGVHERGEQRWGGAELVTVPGPLGDRSFGVDHTARRVHPLRGGRLRFELDRGRVGEHLVDQPAQHRGVEAEQVRCGGDDHVTSGEHLVRRQAAISLEEAPGETVERRVVEVTGDAGAVGEAHGGGDDITIETMDGELLVPTLDEVLDRFVALRGAGPAGRDGPFPVGGGGAGTERPIDLPGTLRVDRHRFVGDPGDGPVPEPPRLPPIRHDPVAELDRHPRRAQPPVGGGGVEVLTPQRRVGALEAAPVVEHLHHVGDQDVVVRVRVPRPRRRMPRHRVGHPRRRGPCRSTPPAAAPVTGQLLQVLEGAGGLGVEDPVHVLDPADHPQLGHRLVRRHHQLETRAASSTPTDDPVSGSRAPPGPNTSSYASGVTVPARPRRAAPPHPTATATRPASCSSATAAPGWSSERSITVER